MKYIFYLLAFAAVLMALYLGYITVLGKVMHQETPGDDNLEDYRTQVDQSQKIDDLRDQQKRLMQDRQQRLRDMQRH